MQYPWLDVSSPIRSGRFVYGPLEIDEGTGVMRCHYSLDDLDLVETVDVGPGHEWTPAAYEAARIVALLAGVSYYKAGAPPVIDLAGMGVREEERAFVRDFYIQGLGEFAYRNGLDLADLQIVGGVPLMGSAPPPTGRRRADPSRLLVPFGGGIDSIVTVECLREGGCDMELFVVNRRGVPRFEAIERAAAVTGLGVRRAQREIDPWILSPPEGVSPFNGHVPVTGIVSAIAVLCAVLDGASAVVMSNEWSASKPTLVAAGVAVNHQYSKSDAFESSMRAVLKSALGDEPDFFSLLRASSELWVARRFAQMTSYHPVFRSCNRAFHLDPALRLDKWCGRCDKCCFIDLILAPFMDRDALADIFGAAEPLEQIDLVERFEALIGTGKNFKPFECVGDVDECRFAVNLASVRADRAGNKILATLTEQLESCGGAGSSDPAIFFRPIGSHNIPDDLATSALV